MPVIEEVIREGQLTFTFPLGSQSTKYDTWSHYRNQFNSAFGGTKAIDVVYATADTAWFIEIKDYRVHSHTKLIDLADEVALKVRDTLAGLVSARVHANDPDEKQLADTLLRKARLKVVLHLETPVCQSRTNPRGIDPANVAQKLKQLIRAVDPHPTVVDQNSIKPGMNWAVQG